MPLFTAIDTLSDHSQEEEPTAAASAAAPKGKAKAKAKATTTPNPKATGKNKAKAKAKGESAKEEDGGDASKLAAKAKPKAKAKAKSEKTEGEPKTEPVMKRPSALKRPAAEAAEGKVSNPYLYTKQGIYGVKIDGKQVLTVGGKHRSLEKSFEIAETAVAELRKGASVSDVREMADAAMFNALPWLTDKEAGAAGSKEPAAAPEEAEPVQADSAQRGASSFEQAAELHTEDSGKDLKEEAEEEPENGFVNDDEIEDVD